MVRKKGPIPLKFTHCQYCERQFESNVCDPLKLYRTRDHFIPVCKGGSSRESAANLYVVCQHCNLIKGALMPNGFIHSLAQAIKHKEYRFRSSSFTYSLELMQTVYKNVKTIWDNEGLKNKGGGPRKRKYFHTESIVEKEFPLVAKALKGQSLVIARRPTSTDEFYEKSKKPIDIMEKWRNEPEPNFHQPE